MDFGAAALEDLPRNGAAPPARVDLHGVLSVASGGSEGWRVLANRGGGALAGAEGREVNGGGPANGAASEAGEWTNGQGPRRPTSGDREAAAKREQ